MKQLIDNIIVKTKKDIENNIKSELSKNIKSDLKHEKIEQFRDFLITTMNEMILEQCNTVTEEYIEVFRNILNK